MDANGIVQWGQDPTQGDPIANSIASQGFYQSPEGWAIIGGNALKQTAGAPRIITTPGGAQPPADVLAKYPMASPQENAGFQAQAAQYRDGEGKPVPFSTAILTALAAYAGGSMLGGAASGSEAAAAGAGSASPAASAVADASWGVNPAASTWGSGIGSGAVGGSVAPAVAGATEGATAGGLFGTGITGGQALSGAGLAATLAGPIPVPNRNRCVQHREYRADGYVYAQS